MNLMNLFKNNKAEYSHKDFIRISNIFDRFYTFPISQRKFMEMSKSEYDKIANNIYKSFIPLYINLKNEKKNIYNEKNINKKREKLLYFIEKLIVEFSDVNEIHLYKSVYCYVDIDEILTKAFNV